MKISKNLEKVYQSEEWKNYQTLAKMFEQAKEEYQLVPTTENRVKFFDALDKMRVSIDVCYNLLRDGDFTCILEEEEENYEKS